jgi:2,3-diketo-5-methylthio-1-phosphopentane phosphatase
MTSEHRNIRVFSDFDGTISRRDVGATLFNHFSTDKNYGTVRLWMEGRISSRECLLRECAYITATRQELVEKSQEIEPQPGFADFLSLLRDHAVPLHVLSDGLDFYIDAFLRKWELGPLDVHTNRAYFLRGRLYPFFPYFRRGCGFCGTCKGERIASLSGHGEFTVFIGDGLSDRCAIEHADLVFAHKDLVGLCHEKGIDYQPYKSFHDIIDYFTSNVI